MRVWERWDSDEIISILQKDWSTESRATLYSVLKDKAIGKRTILDVGCGFGRDYEYIKKELNLDYFGIDITPKMIRAFHDHYPEAKAEIGDIYKIPHPDKYFDVVLCSDVLVHIPAFESAIKELFRVCSSTLILKLAYITNGPTYSSTDKNYGFLNICYNIDYVITVLNSVGFKEVEVVALDKSELANDRTNPNQIFIGSV